MLHCINDVRALTDLSHSILISAFNLLRHAYDACMLPKTALHAVEQERANTSSDTAKALYDIAETRLKNNGFGYGEGASLRRTFEGASQQGSIIHTLPGSITLHIILATISTERRVNVQV